jgi:hypothetical protein
MVRHLLLVPNVNALGSTSVGPCIGCRGVNLHMLGTAHF